MEHLNKVRFSLATVARVLAALKREDLDAQQANYSHLHRPDFLWHYLLQTFAVMGGEAGFDGLIKNRANYEQVTFEAISELPAENRLEHVTSVCTHAKVRFPSKKAGFIIACHQKLNELGGLEIAKRQLLALSGREAKIRFLKLFPGIGDKNARNIMMSVYHDDFRDSISIDSRIKDISKKWELPFKSYEDHEEFYLSVASVAGLNGWELDRLMFRFQAVFYPPIAAVSLTPT